MLFMIASRRTPKALIAVVITSVVTEMKVNMFVKPNGGGRVEERLPVGVEPQHTSTEPTMTATALTVTTWAQK